MIERRDLPDAISCCNPLGRCIDCKYFKNKKCEGLNDIVDSVRKYLSARQPLTTKITGRADMVIETIYMCPECYAPLADPLETLFEYCPYCGTKIDWAIK